jgi:omega-6 fatty acid desaturase (delta-12 desaturase)
MTSKQTQKLDKKVYPWKEAVARYQKPDLKRSLWQIVNTIPPYFILLYLMVRSLQVSYWLTLGLAVIAAGFLARIFIIFHDCGHGSFFKSQNANDIVGILTGILTFTPYYYWRRDHAIHHATAGDLSRRGTGDILTLTVKEYLALSPLKRLGYRILRNPVFMFVISPLFIFLGAHRFARRGTSGRELHSVHWTSLAMAVYFAAMILLMGFKTFLLVNLPIWAVAFSAGVWLFYVQHQFEGTYWEQHENWDYATAALKGSSFYKLPRLLQWFSGNIGFHHIHHLSPKIPNYYLEKCLAENTAFQKVKPITFLSSFRSLTFRLWDEDQRRLVGFGALKEIQMKEIQSQTA